MRQMFRTVVGTQHCLSVSAIHYYYSVSKDIISFSHHCLAFVEYASKKAHMIMKSNNCNKRGKISLLSPKMKERFFSLSLGQVFTPRPKKTGQSCRLEKSLVAMITAMLTFLSS